MTDVLSLKWASKTDLVTHVAYVRFRLGNYTMGQSKEMRWTKSNTTAE